MPISELFQQTDIGAYNLSFNIDDAYNNLKPQLYEITSINNARDYYEAILNYIKIVKESNSIKESYIKPKVSELTEMGLRECALLNNRIMLKMISEFCGQLNFDLINVNRTYEILKEYFQVLSLIVDLDEQVIVKKTVNFELIIYRLKATRALLDKYLNNSEINYDEKKIISNFLSEEEFDKLYKFVQSQYLIFAELSIYRKIFDLVMVEEEIINVRTKAGLKYDIKQSIMINEITETLSNYAKEIFKNDSPNIIMVLNEIKEYIKNSYNLLTLPTREIRKLEANLLEVELEARKCRSSSEYNYLLARVKAEFPSIKKKDFIQYVKVKHAKFLELQKETSFIAQIRYFIFMLEFNEDTPLENEWDRKFSFKRKLLNKLSEECFEVKKFAEYSNRRSSSKFGDL